MRLKELFLLFGLWAAGSAQAGVLETLPAGAPLNAPLVSATCPTFLADYRSFIQHHKESYETLDFYQRQAVSVIRQWHSQLALLEGTVEKLRLDRGYFSPVTTSATRYGDFFAQWVDFNSEITDVLYQGGELVGSCLPPELHDEWFGIFEELLDQVDGNDFDNSVFLRDVGDQLAQWALTFVAYEDRRLSFDLGHFQMLRVRATNMVEVNALIRDNYLKLQGDFSERLEDLEKVWLNESESEVVNMRKGL